MTEPDKRGVPARVHDDAGRWLARLQGDITPQVERDFATWLEADPLHRRAYERAAGDWRDSVMLADSEVGRTRGLRRAPFLMRRTTHVGAAGLGLATVLALATVGLVHRDEPFALVSPAEAANYRTAIGEIRTVRLADGSQLTLDTATLVRVTFTSDKRRLTLERGRARFRVAPDGRRPFIVGVAGGEVVARNAVFDVSVAERPARVATISGGVELLAAPSGADAPSQMLAAGQQMRLGGDAVPKPISRTDAQWISGMLGLDATPLGDAIAAINRYNRLQLRLADPGLADLSVTGAFRARDPQGFARGVAAMFDLSIDRSSDAAIILARRRAAEVMLQQK